MQITYSARASRLLTQGERLWRSGVIVVTKPSEDGNEAITIGSLTLAEEAGQGLEDQVRCFLGREVAGGQGGAADVGGVLLPHAERLVGAADEALAAPQNQDGAADLLPGGEALVVVGQVGAGRGAVVGA